MRIMNKYVSVNTAFKFAAKLSVVPPNITCSSYAREGATIKMNPRNIHVML